jgi:protein associated with RNAse G/E
MLDIVISSDRSEWHWKDEDEFSEAEAIGVYSHEKVQSIRTEGERVIAMLHANSSPFCDGWENWVPPIGWTIPQFPQGWEDLPIG